MENSETELHGKQRLFIYVKAYSGCFANNYRQYVNQKKIHALNKTSRQLTWEINLTKRLIILYLIVQFALELSGALSLINFYYFKL